MENYTNEETNLVPTADNLIKKATCEQLLECAHLLALSVVHHQAKFGVVPLAKSMAHLHGKKRDAVGEKLIAKGKHTLREALDMVVSRAEPVAKPPPVDNPSPSAVLENRRAHVRINVSAPIRISDASGSRLFQGTLKDISWGGASFYVAEPVAELGDEMKLFLPGVGRREITIQATVLRTWKTPKDYGFGVRYLSLTPQDEKKLQDVLRMLMSSQDQKGKRSEPRIAQRLEIEYGDNGELRATLEDISSGGLMITVPTPLELDQSLQIAISTTEGAYGITLRARVVRQQLTSIGNMDMYRVGLQFEHPTPELRSWVGDMLQDLATINPDHDKEPTTKVKEAS